MKTRIGFVSNSSTTSFTIYGVSLETSSWSTKNDRGIANSVEEKLYEAHKAGKFKSLSTRHGQEGYTCYLGRDWECMGDDQTPRQFKAEVEAEITAFLKEYGIEIENLHFGRHEEAYRDG